MTINVMRDVAAIIPFTKDRRVLLQRKDRGYIWHPGMWCFFGGGIEKGEEREETLRRELEEEIGLLFPKIDYFKTYYYQDIAQSYTKRREGNLYVYTGEFDGDLSIIHLREGAGMSLWNEEEIPTLNMVIRNKEVLMEFYKKLNDNLI